MKKAFQSTIHIIPVIAFCLFISINLCFALGSKSASIASIEVSSLLTTELDTCTDASLDEITEQSTQQMSSDTISVPTEESDSPTAQKTSYILPGKFVVKFKSTASLNDPISLGASGSSLIDQINEVHGVTGIQRVFHINGKIGGENNLSRIYELTVDPSADILSMIEDYQASNLVEYAEPMYQRVELGDKSFPDDPYYWSSGTWLAGIQDEYWIHLIEADAAWPYADGTGVTVAFGETINGLHPDLANQLWINQDEIKGNGIDDDGNGYMDDVYGPCGNAWCHESIGYHGTAIAGLIAAQTNNGQGMASISYGSKLMAMGYQYLNPFKYAVDNGARIISHSLHGRTNAEEDVLEYAYNNGALTFVAAGNAQAYSTTLGTLPTTMNVASVYWTDDHYWSSGWGDFIDVAAPGHSVLTTGQDQRPVDSLYTTTTGTSFAAPITAGLGALLLSYNQDLTPGQLRYVILNSVDDKGDPGWDSYYGHGRINVRKAFDLVRSGSPIPEWDYESKITFPRWVQSTMGHNVEIKGTASSPNFVEYHIDVCEGSPYLTPNDIFYADQFSLVNCRQVASSTTPVVDGVLGSFNTDTLGLTDGTYYFLRMSVTDSGIPYYKPYLTAFKVTPQKIYVPEQYATIQAAVNAAEFNATIYVAPGTYTLTKPSDIKITQNGITLKSINGSTQTIIDCNNYVNCIYFDHVQDGVLEGFTIKNSIQNTQYYGAVYSGGSDVIIKNNIFDNCEQAIWIYGGSHEKVKVINNTIYNARIGIDIWYPWDFIVKNNIVVGGTNAAYGIYASGGSGLIPTYNNVYNFLDNYAWVTPGVGSMEVDPLFVNATSGDFHLTPLVSPCIDAGDPNDAYQNEPEPSGLRINMGAYGNTAEAEISSSSAYICGDANGDRSVDISDVVYLIAYIFKGGSPPHPIEAGDANGDGDVDISDVVYLIAYIFSGGTPPRCP